MMAAHACVTLGIEPKIFSLGGKSELPGAIYLHQKIPFIPGSHPFTLNYVKKGSRKGYATKVYGNEDAPCSWDIFDEGTRNAWSLHHAYEEMWFMYNKYIAPTDISGSDNLEHQFEDFTTVFNTVPAPVWCRYPTLHQFLKQDIWVWEGLPEEIRSNTIEYNGDLETYWYRASLIDGHASTETTLGQVHDKFKPGMKPLTTNCDCYPRICRLGRFGLWQKGILSHSAFFMAASKLKSTYPDLRAR